MQDKIRIDLETGLYIEPVHPDSTGEDIIEKICPDSLFKPRWNGEAWEEGATQEYIDSLTAQPPEPTETERIEALEQALLEIVLGGAF